MVYRLNALPENLSQFRGIIGDMSRPEKTAVLLIAALNLYVRDKDAGIEAMNILRGPRPMTVSDIQFLRDRLYDKPYLPMAYFDGATPENNYTPARPYVLRVMPDPRPQDAGEGYCRVYLTTAGADSPRCVKLRSKGENWYLWEYFGILPGIRVPAKEDSWT